VRETLGIRRAHTQHHREPDREVGKSEPINGPAAGRKPALGLRQARRLPRKRLRGLTPALSATLYPAAWKRHNGTQVNLLAVLGTGRAETPIRQFSY
jgi:hypothetical protein